MRGKQTYQSTQMNLPCADDVGLFSGSAQLATHAPTTTDAAAMSSTHSATLGGKMSSTSSPKPLDESSVPFMRAVAQPSPRGAGGALRA